MTLARLLELIYYSTWWWGMATSAAYLVRQRSVRGTRGRYVANSIFHGLRGPAIMSMALAVPYMLNQEGAFYRFVLAPLSLLVCLGVGWIWWSDDDDDDFFTDAGKRLGRWLRTRRRRVLRPALDH